MIEKEVKEVEALQIREIVMAALRDDILEGLSSGEIGVELKKRCIHPIGNRR